MRPFRLLAAWLVALLLAAGAATAQTAPPAAEARPVLRVATGEAPPFVLRQGDAWTGFSVDLWHAVARLLGAQTQFIDLGRRQDLPQLEAVRSGEADLAISAIVMTPAREAMVDFSIAYLDSGLQIGVNPRAAQTHFGDILPWVSLAAMIQLLVAGLVILLVLAHVLWLVERRHDPRFHRGYLRGIAEAVWGVVLIVATGEHGDRETPRVAKRLTIAALWLCGVILIAQFTATVTSALTVQRMQSEIRGPSDLAGRSIGTVPGSIAAQWLTEQGLAFRPFRNADEALGLLRSGALQAVVYDAPTLRYFSRLFGTDQLTVVGPIFRPEKFGIAVPQGSPLRKRINAALLEMMADGVYEDIHRRWFSDGS